MNTPLRYLRHTFLVLPSLFRLLRAHRQLILVLVRRDLSLRTADTAMGWLWLLLQPGLQVVAFWFLFSQVLQIKLAGRLPFLDYFLAGIVLWFLISEVLLRALAVLNEYSSLYQRSPFPLALLPIMPLVVAGGIFGIVYCLTILFLGGWWAGLMALVTVGLVLVWLLPFCYLVAVMGLFLKDLGQIFPFVLTMGLYLTPILYAPSMMPESLHWILVVNPFADLMAVAHGLIQGEPYTLANLVRIAGWWLVLLAPSWVLFNRLAPHMREAL